MVRNACLLYFNADDSYHYNMNSVDLTDQLWNVYQVDHWMCKYKWWWYLFFQDHGLVLVNAYIIYKTQCEEVKVKPTSHYEFQRLDCLAKIDPNFFGSRDHLVSAVQRRGIIKKDGSKPTTTFSAQKEIEKKRKYRIRKIYTRRIPL